jgi:hypothetical protein
MVTEPLEDYVSAGHLSFFAVLFIAACAYRPLTKAARKFVCGMGDVVLTSPK